MNRKIFAQRVRDYGQECVLAAMGRASIKDRSVAYEAVLEVFDRICADRDTLATGVRYAFDLLPHWTEWENPAAINEALEVFDRLNGEASGGTAPRLAEPPAVPAATAEPASAIAVADQATEEWRWRDAEDRATQPEPAKPEPTDLRTLVEGMNHCVDAAIGSLIGAARDKNLLTIDALRTIARVVEELAKEVRDG